MEYILLDNFNGNLNIVCKDDESGEYQIFDNIEDAEKAKEEYCQDGQIIPLDTDIIKEIQTMKYIIQEMYNSHKDGTFNIVHIGDLVCKILNIKAVFLPSGIINEIKNHE